MRRFFFITFLFAILQSIFPNQESANNYLTNSLDTISLINSKSNSLYAGIDNYMLINKKYLPYKNILVEVERGMAMEDEGYYLIMVGKPGTTVVSIYEYDHGDTLLCFKKRLRILPVPSPFVAFNEANLDSIDSISIAEMKKLKKFDVKFSNDFVDDSQWYNIKTITVGYAYGQVYVTRTCTGSSLSEQVLGELARLSVGKEISFTFTLVGLGDVYRRLEPIRLKLK